MKKYIFPVLILLLSSCIRNEATENPTTETVSHSPEVSESQTIDSPKNISTENTAETTHSEHPENTENPNTTITEIYDADGNKIKLQPLSEEEKKKYFPDLFK